MVVVDPDGAVAQPSGDALRLAGVLRPDRTGQTEIGVVGNPDRVVFVGEPLDGQHRAKRFVVDDSHVLGAFIEDGRQVEEAAGQLRVVRPSATASQHGTLGDPGGDVGLDLLSMRGGDQRTGLGLVVERATEANLLSLGDQRVDEPLVQLVLHYEPRTGRAHLARVQEDRGERHVDRGVEVRIGEYHVRVLAAQFQGDALDRVGGSLHHCLARGKAAGERDQVDVGV